MDSDRQENGMDSFEAWLAQMPREGVRQRITMLEQELAFLRRLERLSIPKTPPDGVMMPPASPLPPTPAPSTGDARPRRRRLSPERAAIVEVIKENPSGMSPTAVARALGKEQNAVQTAMSRMAQAGQLVRVEQGNYRLPPHILADRLLAEGGDDGPDEEAPAS